MNSPLEFSYHPFTPPVRCALQRVRQLAYLVAHERKPVCRQFGGVCDDEKSSEEGAGLCRGKIWEDSEFESFFQRLITGQLWSGENVWYQQWLQEEHPEPLDEMFGEQQQRMLAQKLFGYILKCEGQQMYCFGNCELGLTRRLLAQMQPYVLLAFEVLSEANKDVNLYNEQDFLLMMENFYLDTSPAGVLFAKRCVAAFRSGAAKAIQEERDEKDKEREKKE